MESVEFFGPLTRRAVYKVKPDGTYYSYSYYRQHFQHEIAEDCKERCVYCDSHECEMGGREAMEIDHFRPYSRVEFEALEDDPYNFHHACARCNRLKSDYWECKIPQACHDGKVGFVDPFIENRSDYFEVALNGELIAKRGPAAYLITLLSLNRGHLKQLREKRILQAKLKRVLAHKKPLIEAAVRGEAELSKHEIADLARMLLLCESCLNCP